MKRKVLVIPSWYPTTRSPAVGTFCREQTELLSRDFDMRILYPRMLLISKKNTIKRPFEWSSYVLSDELAGDIPGTVLETRVSTYLSYSRRVHSMIDHCSSYIKDLAKGGWKPDLVHAHGTIYGGVIATAIGKVLEIPVVLTEHHSLLVSDFDAASWRLYKEAQESSTLVLAVSQELKKMILMNGVRCRISVVGNLIDDDRFTLRNKEDAQGPFKLLFIAVPSFTKDIPTFIRSLRLIKDSGFANFRATMVIPDIRADLTGEEIAALCRENGVQEHCVILGTTERDQIAEMMKASNLLVSTSITETFGLSVAEAIMCGIPVIATRSGGVEDFVNAGNGILVNIGDYDEVAKAVIRFMRGEIKMDAESSREELVSRFGKKAFKERIWNIYSDTYNSLA
jgi:glycosyltransferase involved in cell wall biosynthesis